MYYNYFNEINRINSIEANGLTISNLAYTIHKALEDNALMYFNVTEDSLCDAIFQAYEANIDFANTVEMGTLFDILNDLSIFSDDIVELKYELSLHGIEIPEKNFKKILYDSCGYYDTINSTDLKEKDVLSQYFKR